MKHQKYSKGYTLLFSVLTAVLVLGVAIFIVGVARRQYLLTTTARDSISALYAADSGIECAMQNALDVRSYDLAYNNYVILNCENNIFTESTPAGVFDRVNTTYESAPGGFVEDATRIQAPPPAIPPAYMHLQFSNGTCALLKVWRGLDSDTGRPKAIIVSRGYSQCSGGNPTQSARTVERAMQYSSQ